MEDSGSEDVWSRLGASECKHDVGEVGFHMKDEQAEECDSSESKTDSRPLSSSKGRRLLQVIFPHACLEL